MDNKTTENGQQNTRFNFQIPAFVHNGIETGRTRFHTLEEQAHELFGGLKTRGNKEIETIRERIPSVNLREKLPVEELVEKAKTVETETRERAEAIVGEVERRVQSLQDALLSLVGIASRDQVNELSRELSRVSKRIDRLARQARPEPTKKAVAKPTTTAAANRKTAKSTTPKA